MKKFCVWFGLLMSTAVFTACGTGIKNSSERSNSSVSMQTQNINIEIENLVNLGSDPQAYMLYGSYRNEEEYKDEDGSYAEKHADDYDYMTLQLADSEEYEVQILPVELQADTDFLNSDLAGKTDEELKDEVGLTDQQISALHEYWQYNHMRANFVERKKYSEDGEYSYSTNNFFQFAYEVVGDKLYMGLEALITDEEDETKLEYYVQDREAYNLKLSEERAQTVADYIKAGYPELANVIEVVGNGENNLILDGEGKEDAAASRRVEVRYVLKTE